MQREDIVTNGCIGKCCEAFHLPYTPAEFKAIKQVVENYYFNKTLHLHALAFGTEEADYKSIMWINRNGEYRDIPSPRDIEYIIDMIIFIGEETLSYETGNDITEEFKSCYPNLVPFEGANNNMIFRNGKLHGIYYTCKHFDKELKICKEYEKRPALCRHHGCGNKCGYAGCKMKVEQLANVCLTEDEANEIDGDLS